MSQQEQRGQAPGGFDPEAEQEVDFSRYARLLVVRWWLLAAGLVAGALIGYAVSLSGNRGLTAGATIYLGQPYSVSGGLIQTLQQNPSTVTAIVESESVIRKVATSCKAKPADVGNSISVTNVKTILGHEAPNSIVKISVEGTHGKQIACVANGLARTVATKIGVYARQRIANFRRRIAADEESISTIKASLASAQVSTTDKLLFQLQLRNFQEDGIAAQQFLLQAEQVESPQVLTPAVAEHVTARSRRNSIVVGALIGLVLGILAAVFWDRIVARLPRPDEE